MKVESAFSNLRHAYKPIATVIFCACTWTEPVFASSAKSKELDGYDKYAETESYITATPMKLFKARKFEAGAPVKFSTYVMKNTDLNSAPVFLMLEFNEKSTPAALEKYSAEKLIPPGLVVFVSNASIKPTVKGGFPRYMRGVLFGNVGRGFPDMVVEELLPFAAAQAKVKISEDPDMHFVAGSSAGGGATVNMLWYRNDFFRRGYAVSPVVPHGLPTLVRMTESKPMRIYITTGDREPDRIMGDLFFGDFQLRAAFDYAGYPCELEYFPNGGHNAGKGSPETMRRMLGFVWKNWETEKITPPRNPVRVASLVAGRGWEKVSETVPAQCPVRAAGGEYTFEGGKIYFTKDGEKRVAASGFQCITGISLSSDLWKLYVSDKGRRHVSAMVIAKDGSLGFPFRHAEVVLHDDAKHLGPTDIVTLANDRILFATELGVQSAMSFGVTDVILPLPGDAPADRVWMKGKTLYAASGKDVFRRELLVPVADENRITEPDKAYYAIEGENRNSSHLDQIAPAIEAERSIVITNRIVK